LVPHPFPLENVSIENIFLRMFRVKTICCERVHSTKMEVCWTSP